MAKEEVELLAKVGPKGQIVLRREIRRSLGIEPGSMVIQSIKDKEIRIRPVEKEEVFRRVDALAKKVGKYWPKGLTSVELMKRERD